MTVRQEAYQLINKLPDDTVLSLVELLKKMSAPFIAPTGGSMPVQFGLGKGQITDPDDFDLWDGEIAAMFERNSV